MADVLDAMQDRMAFLNEMHDQALINQATRKTAESAHDCACGNPIPDERRKALRGVLTCFECQNALEKQLKSSGFSLARQQAGGPQR